MVKGFGGILQARILECVAIPFCGGIFLIQGSNLHLPHRRQNLYRLATSEAPPSFIFSAYLPGVPLNRACTFDWNVWSSSKSQPSSIMQLMCLESGCPQNSTLQFGHIWSHKPLPDSASLPVSRVLAPKLSVPWVFPSIKHLMNQIDLRDQ